MARCIEKLPHSCGSGDGLQVFEQEDKTYDAYCFACGKYEPDPYKDQPADYKPTRIGKTDEQIKAEIVEISSYQTVSLPDRKLRQEALLYFGVKVGLSEVDGQTPEALYFPYENDVGLTGYKARIISTKNMWSIGTTKGAGLFGWKQALSSGSKRLFITEGELDAAALFQALKDKSRGGKWEHLIPAVCSIKNGAGGAKSDIAAQLDDIQRNFKEVVLVFDNDAPGKQAVQDVLKILPTAMAANVPHGKDANDSVIKGYSSALADAVLFKAEVPKNTRIVQGSSLHEAGRKQAEWGLSWPWKKLTDITRGVRFGETVYIGAGVKMGKSELVNAIGAHHIKEHGLKIFMAKPEESNRKSYQMVMSKLAGRIFHDPNIPFDFVAYDKVSAKYGDCVYFLDLYQHMGWKELKTDIHVAVQQGCRIIFIDPITNLVNGEASGEQNTMLQEIAQELAAMAKDLDIIVYIFCHLKAPTNGDSHERGGRVFSHQFAGSRAMMRSCNMMLGLEGNKDPNLKPEERNMRHLVLLEDREFGATGTVALYWDERTGLFNECPAVYA